jgi:hypothetical protein
VLLSVCSISFAISPSSDSYQLFPQFNKNLLELFHENITFQELLEFVSDLEKDVDLHEKYDLDEINDFLVCVSKLGTLNENSEEAHKLNQDILDLYEEALDENIANLNDPSWYKLVYFPDQLAPLSVDACGIHPIKATKKAAKKVGHSIKKAGKATIKATKSVIKEIVEFPKKAEKFFRKNLKKPSKKAWNKTKEFIKEHKKPIVIGLLIATIVSIGIVIAPEVVPLIGALFPQTLDESSSSAKLENSAAKVEDFNYTEEQFVQDYFELVQENFNAQDVEHWTQEDIPSSTFMEKIRYVGSKISHDLIDVIDEQFQYFNKLTEIPDALHQWMPILPSLDRKEPSLFESSSANFIDYLHQKTDAAFDTSLADLYTPEAKAAHDALKIRTYEGYVPLPGNPIGNSKPTKNLLKKFTEYNYRKNLKAYSPQKDYSQVHAHHVFPQAFKEYFIDKGINIHDPKLMTWWEESTHLPNAKSYNDAWLDFIRKNPNASKDQILEKGKQLMKNYGKEVNY